MHEAVAPSVRVSLSQKCEHCDKKQKKKVLWFNRCASIKCSHGMRKVTYLDKVNLPGDVFLGLRGCAYTFQKQQVTSQPWVPRQVLAAACCVSIPLIPFLFNYLCRIQTTVFLPLTSFAHTFGLHEVQTINDDLNASLATADELSKEFSSLLNEVSSKNKPEAQVQYWYSPPLTLNYVQKCTYFFLDI